MKASELEALLQLCLVADAPIRQVVDLALQQALRYQSGVDTIGRQRPAKPDSSRCPGDGRMCLRGESAQTLARQFGIEPATAVSHKPVILVGAEPLAQEQVNSVLAAADGGNRRGGPSMARLCGSCPLNPQAGAFYNDEFVCLSPDGTKVLFTSTLSGSVNEYLVVASNQRPPKLTGR